MQGQSPWNPNKEKRRNMRISRVYTDSALEIDCSLQLGAVVSHYLAHVLRLAVADQVHLFNGRDGEFDAQITHISKHEVSASLLHQRRCPVATVLCINLGLDFRRDYRFRFCVQ